MHVASDCCILVLHSSTSVACRSQQCAYMNNFAEQGSKRIAGFHTYQPSTAVVVSQEAGGGALLMTTNHRLPLLVILQKWKSHRQLFCPGWGSLHLVQPSPTWPLQWPTAMNQPLNNLAQITLMHDLAFPH